MTAGAFYRAISEYRMLALGYLRATGALSMPGIPAVAMRPSFGPPAFAGS